MLIFIRLLLSNECIDCLNLNYCIRFVKTLISLLFYRSNQPIKPQTTAPIIALKLIKLIMDPSLIPQITYHSRRKDNNPQQQSPNTSALFYGNHSITQEQFSYVPVVNIAKRLYQQQQYNHQSKQHNHANKTINTNRNNQQSLTKQFYLENPSNYKPENKEHTTNNLPSFSNLTPVNHQAIIGYEGWNKNSQQYQLRQKIKSLNQHLKCALQGNNQMEQKCNGLRCRLQQNQQLHINQLSLLKAQLIISHNINKQKSILLEQLTNKSSHLQQQIKSLQQKQLLSDTQLQNLINENSRKQNEIEELRVRLSEYQLRRSSEQCQVKRMVNSKNREIQQLKLLNQQLSLNTQHTSAQHQQLVNQLQQQIINAKKSNQTLLATNTNLTTQSQSLRDRIAQLNSNINDICQQSQEVFEEVNRLTVENGQLLKEINQVQSKKDEVWRQNKLLKERVVRGEGMEQQLKGKEEKLEQLVVVNADLRSHNEDLLTKCDILQKQYTCLSQNHTHLQEQNIILNKNNSSLIGEIQLLNSQIRQLKQVILNQSMKESQLQRKMQMMEERGDQTRRGRIGYVGIDREKNNFIYKTVTEENQPTRQFNNYIDNNSKYPQLQQQHPQLQLTKQQKNITEPTLPQNIPLPTTQPYSKYLSFQIPPSNRRSATCAAQAQRQQPTNLLSRRHQQLKPRSKSTHPDLQPCPNQQRPKPYNNRPNFSNNLLLNQRSSSLTSMRQSVDLRQKSLQLKKASQQLYKQSQSHLNKNVYNYNSNHDLSHVGGAMFFNKLERMKVWTSQLSTQHNTQRQVLDELPPTSTLSNTSYLLNRDVPVHTVIKQKSNVINNLRKNLLNYSLNVNNQTVQRNILKLQKTNLSKNNVSSNGYASNSNKLNPSENQNNLTLNLSKENNLSDLSPIGEEMSTNKKHKQIKNNANNNNKLTSAIYQNCKKVLYNHTEN